GGCPPAGHWGSAGAVPPRAIGGSAGGVPPRVAFAVTRTRVPSIVVDGAAPFPGGPSDLRATRIACRRTDRRAGSALLGARPGPSDTFVSCLGAGPVPAPRGVCVANSQGRRTFVLDTRVLPADPAAITRLG